MEVGMKRSFVCFLFALALTWGQVAYAQVDINGPGTSAASPIRVNVSPPGAATTVIYTLKNVGNEALFVTPSV